jgi:hypothetical protein
MIIIENRSKEAKTMKRATLVLVLVFLVGGIMAVSAQEQEPKIYVKTVPIMSILNHALGYKVLYLKSSMDVGEFYVPHTWFKAGGKAELVLGTSRAYPYFSVYYRDGKFDHIKLYAHENIGHLSWGRLKRQEGDSSKFDIETLDLEY